MIFSRLQPNDSDASGPPGAIAVGDRRAQRNIGVALVDGGGASQGDRDWIQRARVASHSQARMHGRTSDLSITPGALPNPRARLIRSVLSRRRCALAAAVVSESAVVLEIRTCPGW